MRYIFSSDYLDEKLTQLLDDCDPRLRLYVYRMDTQGRKITPALFKGYPFPDLCEVLRDVHGGGDFALMIRRGKTMELSGIARIAPPPVRRHGQ